MAGVHTSLYPHIDWEHSQFINYSTITSSGFTVPKNGIVMSSLYMTNEEQTNRYIACMVNGVMAAHTVWNMGKLHTAVFPVSYNDVVKVYLSNGAQANTVGTFIRYVPYK